MKSEKIFLVGFMGCGKSTYGRKLATKLGWDFIDLDDYIEEKEGRSIKEIFENNGEDYFRGLETKTLQEVNGWTNTVISCGGGTPCFNNNMEVINKMGTSVYIQLPGEVLKGRLEGERAKRPLVAELSASELLDFILKKLKERNPYYTQAKFVFDYENESEEAFFTRLNN